MTKPNTNHGQALKAAFSLGEKFGQSIVVVFGDRGEKQWYVEEIEGDKAVLRVPGYDMPDVALDRLRLTPASLAWLLTMADDAIETPENFHDQ